LKSYPQIASDPQKWQTALAASRNLQLRGYDRNSPEYIQAIAHAYDVLNADLTESNQVASPDEALRACQSKYGARSKIITEAWPAWPRKKRWACDQ
jgi:hypothetical protein